LFKDISGTAALFFNNLRSTINPKFAYRSGQTDSQEKAMIRVSHCDIERNKKYGILFNNCFMSYKLKSLKIKENKASGIKMVNVLKDL
jgi:hypothetical protein